MDVFSFYKFRHQGMLILQHDGTEALQLTFLFSIYEHLIIILHFLFNVGNKEFKVLVENRLWSDGERNGFYIGLIQRYIQVNVFFGKQFIEERTVPVHIRRIQPDKGIGREKAYEAYSLRFLGFPGSNVRVNIGRFNRLY